MHFRCMLYMLYVLQTMKGIFILSFPLSISLSFSIENSLSHFPQQLETKSEQHLDLEREMETVRKQNKVSNY